MKRYCLFFICLFFLGCATKSDVDLLTQQIASISFEQQRVRREYKIEIENLKKDLKKQIQTSNFSVRSSQADIVSRVEVLRLNLARLEGEYDLLKKELNDNKNATMDLKTKISSIDNSINELRDDIDKLKLLLGVSRSKGVNNSKVNSLVHNKKSKTKVVSKAKQGIEISPLKLYSQALLNFRNKNYYISSHLFSVFIKKFPRHKLTPNAFFWRGECFYRLKQYAKAILNYQKVLDKYPASNKYRPALLKEGISFFKIGKKKAGKILLEDLIKDFPSSKEAKTAKSFLKNNL